MGSVCQLTLTCVRERDQGCRIWRDDTVEYTSYFVM